MKAMMKTIGIVTVLLVGIVWTVGLPQAGPPAKPEIVDLLFVQNASNVVIDTNGRTLTLKGVGPTTLYFSDRPVRLAGHFRTKKDYLPLWTDGKDSFLKDPPNATLSVFEKDQKNSPMSCSSCSARGWRATTSPMTSRSLRGSCPAREAPRRSSSMSSACP